MPVGTSNQVIAGGGVHHIAIQVRDWDASMRLYRDVLGMRVVAQFGTPERPIALLDAGDGAHVELLGPLPDAPGGDGGTPALAHLALTTTDTRAATERVRAAGYTVTVEPKDMQLGPLNVTLAFFTGPDGEVLEFFQVNSSL
jgi:glyoxylase I family protein